MEMFLPISSSFDQPNTFELALLTCWMIPFVFIRNRASNAGACANGGKARMNTVQIKEKNNVIHVM